MRLAMTEADEVLVSVFLTCRRVGVGEADRLALSVSH